MSDFWEAFIGSALGGAFGTLIGGWLMFNVVWTYIKTLENFLVRRIAQLEVRLERIEHD